MALSGLFGGGGDAGKPREFNLSGNPFFQATLDRTKGPDYMRLGATGALGALQRELFGDAGLFSGMARNNQGADLAGELGMDFLGGLNQFNPADIAAMQYGLLSPMLLRDQEQQFLDLEGRQVSQGRLGSVPGANDLNALFDAQEDSRQKLLFNSFEQGLAAQQQQADLGTSLLQFDPALRGLFQNLGTNALTGGLNIQNTAANTFNSLAGAQGVEPVQAPGMGQFFGAGLLNSGATQLAGGLGGLFQRNPFGGVGG